MTRKWKFLIIVGLTLRLVLFFFIRPWDTEVEDKKILASDPAGYHSLALSIKKSGFTDRPFVFRTPGYPLFIYFVYFFSGPRPWVVILLQFLLSLLSAWILYKISLLYVPEIAAFLSALFFFWDPHVNLFNQTLFSETLFITLFLLSVYLFLKWINVAKTVTLYKNNSDFRISVCSVVTPLPFGEGKGVRFFFGNLNAYAIILSAITLGLATLVRPVTLYFPLFIFMIIVFSSNLSSQIIKWKFGLIFLSMFFLTLSPWMLRNYFRYDHFSLSTIQGYNQLFCNVTFSEAVRTGKSSPAVEEEFRKEALAHGVDDKFGNPFANAEYYQKVSLKCISAHPGFYAKRFMNGFVFSYLNLNIFEFCHYLNLPYTPHTWGLYQNPPFHILIKNYFSGKTAMEVLLSVMLMLWLIFSYTLALMGAVFLIKERKIFILTFILLTIFYFGFLAGDVGEVRYKLPAVPFYLMLSGYGILRFWFKGEPHRIG